MRVWIAVVFALVFSSAGAAGAWWVAKNRYETQIALLKQVHAEAVAQAVEQTRVVEQAVSKKYVGALNAARSRNTVVQGAVDGARDELERLRNVIAARAAQPAEPAATPGAVTPTTRDDLQRTCEAAVAELAAELVEVARAADAHASDLKMMIDAWPTIESIGKDK